MIRMQFLLGLALLLPALAQAGDLQARNAHQAYAAGNYREAIEKFAREGTSPHDHAAQMLVARSYLITGEPNRALAIAQAVLDETPRYTDALVLIGDMNAMAGDWQGAAKSYAEATTSDSPSAEIWLSLAQAWQALGNKAMVEMAMSGYRTFKTN